MLGGILVLGTVPDPENYSTYFMKIDGVKFKRKVVPGRHAPIRDPTAGAHPPRRGRRRGARLGRRDARLRSGDDGPDREKQAITKRRL